MSGAIQHPDGSLGKAHLSRDREHGARVTPGLRLRTKRDVSYKAARLSNNERAWIPTRIVAQRKNETDRAKAPVPGEQRAALFAGKAYQLSPAKVSRSENRRAMCTRLFRVKCKKSTTPS